MQNKIYIYIYIRAHIHGIGTTQVLQRRVRKEKTESERIDPQAEKIYIAWGFFFP